MGFDGKIEWKEVELASNNKYRIVAYFKKDSTMQCIHETIEGLLDDDDFEKVVLEKSPLV
jgi:hypothetical protein